MDAQANRERLYERFSMTIATLNAHCPAIECPACANFIRRSLAATPGVQAVAVNFAGKSVSVRYDADIASESALRDRLTQAGYPPE